MESIETPDSYIAALEPARREMVESIRTTINANIQDGFEEIIDFGMLAWVVPLERFPNTYNGYPMMYVALASQKNYVSLYLMAIYADPELAEWFTAEYATLGRKPNMGKSCIRFRKQEDIPLELIGRAVAMFSVDGYLEMLTNQQDAARARRMNR
jgi:hypothetical protein